MPTEGSQIMSHYFVDLSVCKKEMHRSIPGLLEFMSYVLSHLYFNSNISYTWW